MDDAAWLSSQGSRQPTVVTEMTLTTKPYIPTLTRSPKLPHSSTPVTDGIDYRGLHPLLSLSNQGQVNRGRRLLLLAVRFDYHMPRTTG